MIPHFTKALFLCLSLIVARSAEAASTKSPRAVDFRTEVLPIISSKCFHCHGPDEAARKAGLRLDLREEAILAREGALAAIAPGRPNQSELVARIKHADPDEIMPPTKEGHPLSASEISILTRWIEQGAHYEKHWAFVPPQRPALPKIKNRRWPKNEIDHFILARLEVAKLKPSPAAERSTLFRRLALDLTGLPAAPEQMKHFIADRSADAYEKAVDQLLSSPAFGEHWARMWLDLARYADSAGYGSDPLRLNIWPYRDWVINAFNRNLPFDQFTIEQIAGDLLENATDEQKIASAFHRNTMTNTEGGTDDEEWRVAAVKDRANVTAQAWMGLTLGCAQCHTHKFDPITQTEYYQFYAFFNQTKDTDKGDENPTLPLPTPDERKRMDALKEEIAGLEMKLQANIPEVLHEVEAWAKAHAAPTAWNTLPPQISAESFLTTNADHSVAVTNLNPATNLYSVTYLSSLTNLTGLRLEALREGSGDLAGPGLGENGQFVLNQIEATFTPHPEQRVSARYIRIEIPGDKKILSLAEVEAWAGGTNLAKSGKATQSSTGFDGPAELAIDGNTNGIYDAKSTTHTVEQTNPWWELDFGQETSLDSISIWNRVDAETGERLAHSRVSLRDAEGKIVWEQQLEVAPKPSTELAVNGPRKVRFARASATVTAPEYDVEKAIDGKTHPKAGWSARASDTNAAAVFELAAPLPPGQLVVSLLQQTEKNRLLARFRLLGTTLPAPIIAVPATLDGILGVSSADRSKENSEALANWFRKYAEVTRHGVEKIEATRKKLDAIKPLQLPVMEELAHDQFRVTRLLNKGSYLTPGGEVAPGVPAAFHSWPADAPTNRLGVAQWLMSPENPLTARVMVNRFWSQIFGQGLVETEEDFGTQGTLPSHPELLDWLAIEFRDGGWDMKQIVKKLVMSATYRQSSRLTPALIEKDPRNLLLAHAPRRRLEAETLRDQALALGGLLSSKRGGPSVYPPQPDGLWRPAFNGERTYATSTGEDRYRRGLYSIWRRTIPNPSMATFDAPSRESCTFRRLPTNTPLQAYVTLNDPVYVEASQALARRLMKEGGASTRARVEFGLRLVLARSPQADEVRALSELYTRELKRYSANEEDAMKLATEPLGKLPVDLTLAEAAAWTVVANVLLNLDGVLTKG